MSKRGDKDYKPKQTTKGQIPPSKKRPIRVTRKERDYTEDQIVITSEEEASHSEMEGAVDRVNNSDLDSLEPTVSDTRSLSTIKTEPCWSPNTFAQKANNVYTGLSEI